MLMIINSYLQTIGRSTQNHAWRFKPVAKGSLSCSELKVSIGLTGISNLFFEGGLLTKNNPFIRLIHLWHVLRFRESLLFWDTLSFWKTCPVVRDMLTMKLRKGIKAVSNKDSWIAIFIEWYCKV
jgi:hypothetical protein